MKKILSLLTGLALVTPLSVNLYSCNIAEKEDPKISQQKLDNIVDLFNYYNENNYNSNKYINIEFDEFNESKYSRYLELGFDKVYKLSFQQIMLNSVIFDFQNSISLYIKLEKGQDEIAFKKDKMNQLNFLKLNLVDYSEYMGEFSGHGASYWADVFSNLQVSTIAESDDIFKKIKDEKKGCYPDFKLIELKLQYVQNDGVKIISKNSFKIRIYNNFNYEEGK